MPETSVETTASPVAIASASTFGMPSRSPSATTWQGSTNMLASR